jgi:hypothetical protein
VEPAGRTNRPPIAAVERILEAFWPEEIDMRLDLDPRHFAYARDWPNAFADSAFEPPREMHIPNPPVVDRDGLVAFFGSMGWIGARPDSEREQLLDELRSHLTAAEYGVPFETYVYTSRLRRPA